MAIEIFNEPGRSAFVLTADSGTVTTSGNTTLITPASGLRVRVFYLSYNNTAATVEAYFAFGGTSFLKNKVLANSVIAKDFGDFRCIQGSVDQALVINLDVATTVNWNVLSVQV